MVIITGGGQGGLNSPFLTLVTFTYLQKLCSKIYANHCLTCGGFLTFKPHSSFGSIWLNRGLVLTPIEHYVANCDAKFRRTYSDCRASGKACVALE